SLSVSHSLSISLPPFLAPCFAHNFPVPGICLSLSPSPFLSSLILSISLSLYWSLAASSSMVVLGFLLQLTPHKCTCAHLLGPPFTPHLDRHRHTDLHTH